ncbi:hypothetical protein KCU73_g2862, partial [Aureobasidium melanogenum]
MRDLVCRLHRQTRPSASRPAIRPLAHQHGTLQASQLVASAEQDSQCPDSLHRDALMPASASGRDSDHLATSPVGRGVDRISGLESSSNLSLHLLPDPPPSRLGQSQPRSRRTHLCTSAARPGSQAKPTISKKPHLVVRSCSTLAP